VAVTLNKNIMELKPGMIVTLKSGGPKMTVKFLNTSSTWTCTWFINDEAKEHGFSEEQLEVVNSGTDYSKWSDEDLEKMEYLVTKYKN
jgi:uncharacterized protein YodC (DUF2158 family)